MHLLQRLCRAGVIVALGINGEDEISIRWRWYRSCGRLLKINS